MSYLSLVVSFTAFSAAKVSKINHIVVGMRLCQKSILSHLEFNTLKPELSQARALLCPKKIVILGIEFKLWQRYNLKLTLPTKLFFFLPILEKEFPRIIQSAS